MSEDQLIETWREGCAPEPHLVDAYDHFESEVERFTPGPRVQLAPASAYTSIHQDGASSCKILTPSLPIDEHEALVVKHVAPVRISSPKALIKSQTQLSPATLAAESISLPADAGGPSHSPTIIRLLTMLRVRHGCHLSCAATSYAAILALPC